MKRYYSVLVSLPLSVLALGCAGSSVDESADETNQQATAPLVGTVYYVSQSAAGSANLGTAQDPFRTIQACANKAVAGDTCSIASGVYREMVTVKSSGTAGSPVTFTGAAGANVVISAADLVPSTTATSTSSAWQPVGKNVYVSNFSIKSTAGYPTQLSVPTQLYVDGKFYEIARCPSSVPGSGCPVSGSTYFLASSDTPVGVNNAVTNVYLPPGLTPSQVVGATLVNRLNNSVLGSNVVDSYDPATGQITYTPFADAFDNTLNSQSGRMLKGFGFYLQNKPWMLYPGSWAYVPTSATTGDIYVSTATGDSPSLHSVEVSTRPYGVLDVGRSFVTIQNLTVANSTRSNVYVDNRDQNHNLIGEPTDIKLTGLTVKGGGYGIRFHQGTNITIDNNRVSDSVSGGMLLHVASSAVTNNTVNNGGHIGGPVNNSGGISISAYGPVSVTGNTVTNSGMNGISYGGDAVLVQNNNIDQSCLVLNDCGGIYSSNANQTWTSQILGNTVTNSIGNTLGTGGYGTLAHGIYLDDLNHNYLIDGNRVASVDYGIYIHAGYGNTITNNSVYLARAYGLLIANNGARATPTTTHDNVVRNNTFEAIPSLGLNTGVVAYANYAASNVNFGTFDSNKYCHPTSPTIVSTVPNGPRIDYTSMSLWRAQSGQDLNSTEIPQYCVPQVTLNVRQAVGGSVTFFGSLCTSCTIQTAFGDDVPLVPKPDAGYVFKGWTGACSGAADCTVVMTANQSVMPVFAPAP